MANEHGQGKKNRQEKKQNETFYTFLHVYEVSLMLLLISFDIRLDISKFCELIVNFIFGDLQKVAH